MAPAKVPDDLGRVDLPQEDGLVRPARQDVAVVAGAPGVEDLGPGFIFERFRKNSLEKELTQGRKLTVF